jgi:hypothetical protein
MAQLAINKHLSEELDVVRIILKWILKNLNGRCGLD